MNSVILSMNSYRNATVRLRKMGLPELDVSTDRLRLRSRIEEEINTILNQQSFFKISDYDTSCEGQSDAKDKTSWNRSILLYQRITKDGVTKKDDPSTKGGED